MPLYERGGKIKMRMPFSIIACLAGVLASLQTAAADPANLTVASSPYIEPLSVGDEKDVRALYKQLIDAENRHDLAVVKPLLWKSPSTLFVAKTATPAEGNWAGFWGTDVVMRHFQDLYQGPFRIDPDYSKEKVVGLTAEVAETYVPVKITVAYAGQTPVPKPFLMILDWIKTPGGWEMATDIALPIPPPPQQK